MINFGPVPIGAVLPVFFDSYAGSTGASVTISGLAVTDIEIYKGTSMTQRASDAGYTLLDTDGIDIDGITGINGFSIDTGDNTDAGFYASGSYYTVVVSAITVDSQTVNFVAATFRCVTAEGVAGQPKVDTASVAGSAVSTTTAQIGVNVVQISTDSTAADNAEAFFDGTGYAGTNNVIPTVTTTGTATNVTTVNGLATGVITAASIAAGTLLDAAGIRTAIGLASANLDTQLSTIDDFLDTEVAAIKAKTDSLTYTVAGKVDANITHVIADPVQAASAKNTNWGGT